MAPTEAKVATKLCHAYQLYVGNSKVGKVQIKLGCDSGPGVLR